MANAPLTIRFASDVDAAKKGVVGLAASIAANMASVAGSALAAGKTVQSAAQTTIGAFQNINKAAGLVAPAVFGIATAFVVFKTAQSAIGAMRKELTDLLEIADKSAARGLSPTFFQAFIAGGKGAVDKIKELEDALDHAFQATKDVLNPNWSVWDVGVTKVTAVEEAMRGMRELFSTDQSFTGLDLFRNAENQDQKIQAVLIAMKELNAIGQKTAALDLGEKMFGAQFADQIRRGQESVDRLLDTITKKLVSPDILSDDTVKRAKELDDRLNDAWRTINERMKPDWNDLGDIAMRIKGVWTSIIEAVAAYKIEANKANLPTPIATDESARNNPDVNSAAFANPVILNQGRRRRGQSADISPTASIDESRGLDMTRREMPQDTTETVPMPMRRPLDAPKPPPADTTRDAFQTTIDQINKHMAAVKAEAATIDANTATRDRAKAVAQLEEAAKRANTAAGKENTAVTDEQRAAIEKQADALMKVVAAAEKAKVDSSIRQGAATAFLTPEDVSIAQQLRGIYGNDIPAALASTEAAAMRLNDANREIASTISTNMTTALADVFDGTKSAGAAVADFAKIALRAIEETIIKLLIVGPLMRGLQGGLGGLFGFADGGEVGPAGSITFGSQSFPKFATGGGVITGPGTGRSDSILIRASNGEFMVNAEATARNRGLLEAINSGAPGFADGGYVSALPSMSGRATGGGINVTVHSNPVFQAGMTPTDMAQIRTMLAQNDQITRQGIVSDLRTGLRNDSSFLG